MGNHAIRHRGSSAVQRGLSGLQTASIVAALPFAVVLIGMCVSLLKALQAEDRERRQKEKRQRQKLKRLLEEQENMQNEILGR